MSRRRKEAIRRLIRACEEMLRQAEEYAEMGRDVPTSGAANPFDALRDALKVVRASARPQRKSD